MVYVATGILILFIGLAVTGHAIKRKLQYRAKLKSEQPAPPPDQQNLAPGQVNDYVILKEPKDTLDPHPWYQRLGQSGQVIFPVSEWKKRFFKSPPENERILPNLDEAEKGNSPRKLQKRRGTKPEDRPDLPVRIMPPASAMPWPSLDSGPSESAVLGNHDTNRKAQNFTGGAVEGLSTAQQTVSSKIAATRRSNRSTSA